MPELHTVECSVQEAFPDRLLSKKSVLRYFLLVVEKNRDYRDPSRPRSFELQGADEVAPEEMPTALRPSSAAKLLGHQDRIPVVDSHHAVQGIQVDNGGG